MIKLLAPAEARKIAAGEVIDRPAALVREFIDNAIDSGACHIEVSIEGGGISKTEVIDDGSGMDRDDLELCWQTHATSKIRTLDDLKTATTLGFRGEALAAAAAVSRLEIVTGKTESEAYKLTVGPGDSYQAHLEQCNRTRGTSVRSLYLFDSIPARKRFLKSAGSEANLCRLVFNDKALAFPNIEFRFVQDKKLKSLLPLVGDDSSSQTEDDSFGGQSALYKQRFAELYYSGIEKKYIYEIAAAGKGFNIIIVIGGPELYRQDRRQQFIFANGRRIQEYSLIQAMEYGVQHWFPNGTHPVGAVFINIDPSLADFNVHPAKREARFADLPSIHHAISSALGNFYKSAAASGRAFTGITLSESAPAYNTDRNFPEFENNIPAAASATDPYPSIFHTKESSLSAKSSSRFLGYLFGLFMLVEKEDRFFMIDQHAAHERIIYDSFKLPLPCQQLLVPIPFIAESAEDNLFLRSRKEDLAALGIVIKEDEESWLIEGLPEGWKTGDRETLQLILDLKNSGKNMAESWLSALACRRAVKDGDYLDPDTALNLAEETLRLPVCRCPHGRPIFFELSREDLLKAVRRL